jgi:hypothetical protein
LVTLRKPASIAFVLACVQLAPDHPTGIRLRERRALKEARRSHPAITLGDQDYGGDSNRQD